MLNCGYKFIALSDKDYFYCPLDGMAVHHALPPPAIYQITPTNRVWRKEKVK